MHMIFGVWTLCLMGKIVCKVGEIMQLSALSITLHDYYFLFDLIYVGGTMNIFIIDFPLLVCFLNSECCCLKCTQGRKEIWKSLK